MIKVVPDSKAWTVWDETLLCFRVLQFVQAQNSLASLPDATLTQTLDSNDWFTYQQDMTLCLDVMMAWQENQGPWCPQAPWFDEHKGLVVMDQDSASIARHFRDKLSKELEESVLFHSDDWSFVRIDLGWLHRRHYLTSCCCSLVLAVSLDDATSITKRLKI